MRILLLCLFTSCIQVLQSQNSYYLGISGNDSNSGTSESAPFASFDHAINQAQHGDTVFVLPGVYTNASYGVFDIWKSETTFKINNKTGSSGDYLVIKARYPESVILRGDGSYIFQIRNSSYIRIEGFEIEGEVENIPLNLALQYQFTYKDVSGNILERVPPGTPTTTIETMTFPILNNISRPFYFSTMGILVQGSHHIDVSSNYVHHMPGTGIRAFESDYIRIEKNELHDNSRRSSIGNHGLVIHSATSIDESDTFKIIIQQNKVHSNYNEVYSWSENKTFITPHIDEGKGISLQKNTLLNGWTHGWFLVQNNICFNNGFSGIHLNEGVRARFVNNTCVNNCYTGTGNNIGISTQTADSIEIYNNIIVTPTWGFALNHPNTNQLIIQRNIIQGNLGSDADLVDVESINLDPLFFNAAQNDFRLSLNSPAINQALVSVAPTTDYLGQNRIIPDIGAFEYQNSAHFSVLYQNSLFVFPTSTSDVLYISGANMNTNFAIYDLSGKVHVIDRIIEEKQSVDISELDSGMYIVKCGEQVGVFLKN